MLKVYVGMSADLLHHGHINIIKEAATDVKDKIVTTCFLKWNILVHFSCEEKEAIKRMEVVSNPNFATRVNNLKTVIDKT